MRITHTHPHPTLSFDFPCRDCAISSVFTTIGQITQNYDVEIAKLQEAIRKGRERLSQVGPTNEYIVEAVKEWKESVERLDGERKLEVEKVWGGFWGRWGR